MKLAYCKLINRFFRGSGLSIVPSEIIDKYKLSDKVFAWVIFDIFGFIDAEFLSDEILIEIGYDKS